MAARQYALSILLRLRDQATSKLDKFGASVAKVTGLVAGLGGAILGALGLRSLIDFFRSSVDAAEKLETQMGTLRAVIEATGGAAGLTAEDVDQLARELDDASLGSAEGFRDAGAVLLTYKSIVGDTFREALTLSQDLTQVFGGDVVGATNQLGKALENPIQGITALSDKGVTFSASQKELIKTLVETGNIAKAQGLILEALAGQVGGAGSGASKGLAGAIDGLSTRFTELKEKIGEAILPSVTEFFTFLAQKVGQLTDKAKELVAAGNLQRWAQQTKQFLQEVTASVTDFITAFDFSEASDKAQAFTDELRIQFGGIKESFSQAGAAASIFFNGLSSSFALTGLLVVRLSRNVLKAVDTLLMLPNALGLISDGIRESVQGAIEDLDNRTDALLDSIRKDGEDINKAWRTLAGDIDQAGEAVEDAAKKRQAAMEAERAAAEAARDATVEQITAQFKATVESLKAAKAAEEHREKIEALRAEYRKLIEAGDTQGAAKVLVELNAELRKTEQQLNETGDAADGFADDVTAVAVAFKDLNIKSQAELDDMAKKAVESFQRIRDSGTAAPQDVRRAFLAAAQAQVEAAELSSEAEKRALAIRLELRGATLGLADEVKKLTGANVEVAESADRVAESQKKAADEAKKAAEESQEAAEQAAESAETAADNANNVSIAIGAVAEGYSDLSEAGKRAFDDLTEGLQGLLTADVARSINAQRQILRGVVEAERQWAERVLQTVEALRTASSATEENRLRLQLMSEAGRDMGDALTQAGQEAQAALAAIKGEAESATDALESMIERIEEAQLRRAGDDVALAELKRQRELAEIERLVQQGGNQQTADKLRRLTEEEHKARLREIEERAQAEREAQQRTREESEGRTRLSGRSGRTTGRNGGGAGGISAPRSGVTHVTNNFYIDPAKLTSEEWYRRHVVPITKKVNRLEG